MFSLKVMDVVYIKQSLIYLTKKVYKPSRKNEAFYSIFQFHCENRKVFFFYPQPMSGEFVTYKFVTSKFVTIKVARLNLQNHNLQFCNQYFFFQIIFSSNRFVSVLTRYKNKYYPFLIKENIFYYDINKHIKSKRYILFHF